KKRRPSSPRRANKVRFHRGGEGLLRCGTYVPRATSFTLRVLRVAQPAERRTHARGSKAGNNGGGDLYAKPRPLRQSAGPRGVAPQRGADRTQTCSAADAKPGFACPTASALSLHHGLRAHHADSG